MFIVPIGSSISPVESLFEKNTVKSSGNEDTASFSDVFKEIFSEVQETQRITEEDSVKLAMGEIDDLHTVYNNMTKATVALETFVAVKNASLDAWQQVMQISI